MDEVTRKKWIAKVKKLLAISANGKADAGNAAEAATKLMLKFQILSVELEDPQDSVGENTDLYIELTKSARIPWWKWELAWKVADNASCKPYKLARRDGHKLKGSGISFIGRRSDAQLCCYLFMRLMRDLEEMCKDRIPKSGIDSSYRGRWARDFYAGAIHMLETRMAQARRDIMTGSWMEDEQDPVPHPPSTTALARIDRLGQEVDHKAQSMGLSYEHAPKHGILTPEGWTEGIRAGNEIDMSADHHALGKGLAQLQGPRKTL